MAKQRIKEKGVQSHGEVQVKFQAEAKPDTPFYYVNFISVGHSPYDFVLNVLKLPSSLSRDQIAMAQQGQSVTIEPTLQLIIPPPVAKALVNALSEQCRKFEERFGKIRVGGETNEEWK